VRADVTAPSARPAALPLRTDLRLVTSGAREATAPTVPRATRVPSTPHERTVRRVPLEDRVPSTLTALRAAKAQQFDLIEGLVPSAPRDRIGPLDPPVRGASDRADPRNRR
jgi:hypothetical protein